MTANLRSLLHTLAKLLALPWRLATCQPHLLARRGGKAVWAFPRRTWSWASTCSGRGVE